MYIDQLFRPFGCSKTIICKDFYHWANFETNNELCIHRMESDSVLISALQKFIRRCHIPNSIATAKELCLPYSYQRVARLIRRLYVIVSEDIGIAQSGLMQYLRTELGDNGENITEKDIDVVLRVTGTLASCHKSRLTDHAFIYYKWQYEHKMWDLTPIESSTDSLWQIDNPLLEEDQLLKWITFNYLNRHKVDRLNDCWTFLITQGNQLSQEKAQEIQEIQETWKQNDCILFLVHAALLITRNPPSYGYTVKTVNTVNTVSNGSLNTDTVGSLILPDFVYDMHTKKGREIGRGFGHFINSSCLLENQRPVIPDTPELYDQYWELLKNICVGMP